MCRLFTPELSRWFTHLPGPRTNPSCARAAAGFIGYGEESDSPLFRRLSILAVAQAVNSDQARVTIKARFNYKHFPIAAPQASAGFDCTGRPAGTVNDAAHDVPAPLDVRRFVTTIETDDTVCSRISFDTAPRPGAALKLRAEQHTPDQSRFFVTDGSVRIGHEGRLDSSLEAFRGGWRDGDLYVRFAVPARGSYTLVFGGSTKTRQMFRAARAQPAAGRRQRAPIEGYGDSFGRPDS
jgi:hypothetical protein